MKSKKILAVVVSGLVLASLVSGCTTTKKNNAAVNAPKSVTLKIYLGQGMNRFKDQWTAYMNQFAAKELKDKNITVTFSPEFPDSATDAQLIKTRLTTQDALDIFTVHAGNDIPTYGKAGYLADLTSQSFAAKIIPTVKAAVTYNGKVVAVPIESSAWGYIYNKDIFTKDNIKVPTTLTELKAVTASLKAAGETPWLLAYKDDWVPQLVNSLAVGAYVNTSDKDFLTKMNGGTGSYSEIAGMFDVMDLMNANGTAKPLDLGADAACADFANGKAAMWLQGPWESAAITKANPNFKLGVAALPVNDDPKATMVNLGISTSLCLSSSSKQKAVGEDFLNYILDDSASSAFYQSMQFAPVAKMHTYQVESFVQDAVTYEKAGLAYLDPSQPQAVKDEVGKALQEYYLKTKTKAQVIADLDKVWADSMKAK